jgi:hypothetical protein
MAAYQPFNGTQLICSDRVRRAIERWGAAEVGGIVTGRASINAPHRRAKTRRRAGRDADWQATRSSAIRYASEQRLSPVLNARDGRIGRVTLTRPDVMNAIDDRLPEALTETDRGANADPGMHVVVLSGRKRHEGPMTGRPNGRSTRLAEWTRAE